MAFSRGRLASESFPRLAVGELSGALFATLPPSSGSASPSTTAAAATGGGRITGTERAPDATRSFQSTVAARCAVLEHRIEEEHLHATRVVETHATTAESLDAGASSAVSLQTTTTTTRASDAAAAIVVGILGAVREADATQRAALLPSLVRAIGPVVATLPAGALRESGRLASPMHEAAALFVAVALDQPSLTPKLLETVVSITFATGSLELLLSIAAAPAARAVPRLLLQNSSESNEKSLRNFDIQPSLASSIRIALRGLRYAARLRSRRLDWRALHSDTLAMSAERCRATAVSAQMRAGLVHCCYPFTPSAPPRR